MRIFLLVFVVLCPLLALAQDSKELMVKYDEAFYSGNYEQALALIEQLISLDSQNCVFFREKAKMQALTINKDAFTKTLNHIKQTFDRESAANAIRHVHEWEKLPEDFKAISQSYLPAPIILKISPRDSADFRVASAPQQVNSTGTAADQKVPICYISEYGKKYHAKSECPAVTRGKLVPAYDMSHIKKKAAGACETCWKDRPLF
jgi:hypothetical protein